MMAMALGFLTLFVPLQIFLGDIQGLNTRDTSQPSWPRWRPLDTPRPRR